MQQFWTKTNDLAWAIALAGCAQKTGFSLHFETDDPIIKIISQSTGPQKLGEEVKLPETEDEMRRLDEMHTARLDREMSEIHGLVMDHQMPVFELNYMMLAKTLMLHHYKVFATEGLWAPNPMSLSPSKCAKYTEYHALIQCEDYRHIATLVCQGMGIENPNILNLETLEREEQYYACGAFNTPGLRAIVLDVEHDLIQLLRGWYKDLPHLVERPALITVYPEDQEAVRPRTVTYWAQQIPVKLSEDDEFFVERGKRWQIRAICEHDANKFFRMCAAGAWAN